MPETGPLPLEHSVYRQPTVRGARRRAGAGVSTGSVLVRIVSHLIDVSTAAGLPRDLLLQAAGTTEAELRDPDGRLPVAAEIAVWQALAKHVSDPGFGIRIGAQYDTRQLGLFGYVASFSGTFRHALRRLERFGEIITQAVVFRLKEGRSQVTLAMCHPALGPGLPLAQDARLASVLQIGRDLTGRDIVPAEVSFTYPRPSSVSAHNEFFRCPLRFGQPEPSILFRADDLDLPIVRADETLAGYLSDYVEQVLATLVRGDTMTHAVRAAIWTALGDGKPTLGQVAKILNLPPRTLQRRLAAEGTSVHREIEQIRKTMAVAILDDPSHSIEDVAYLLGYREPSAFFRSFKRWTGATPGSFRTEAS